MLHDLLVLPEIPESLVDVLHSRYMDVQPEEGNRIQELVEIIADVRQPIVMIETAQTKEEKRQWELKVIILVFLILIFFKLVTVQSLIPDGHLVIYGEDL